MVHLLQVEIIEDAATGEFIKFVDADDYLNLTIFEKMLGIANENKVKLVRGNYANVIGPLKIMDSSNWGKLRGNQIVDIRDNKDYIVTEFPGVGNKLIHRDIIGDLRFPEGKKWEDLAIMPVILASSQIIYHMDEPVYNYRAHINSVSIADFFKKIPNIFYILYLE